MVQRAQETGELAGDSVAMPGGDGGEILAPERFTGEHPVAHECHIRSARLCTGGDGVGDGERKAPLKVTQKRELVLQRGYRCRNPGEAEDEVPVDDEDIIVLPGLVESEGLELQVRAVLVELLGVK